MNLQVPMLVCAVAVALLLLAETRQVTPLKIVSKTIASLAFVAYGYGLDGTDHPWFIAGLILSVGGDLALLSHDKKAFLGGLVSFLFAHVAYTVGFLRLGLDVPTVLIAAVPLAGLAAGVYWWLAPHTGTLTKPVLAYIVAISFMVASAIGAFAGGVVGDGKDILLTAAILFFLSDLCVARDRFVSPGIENRWIGLPLYYIAQLLFCVGIANLT